MPNVLEYERRRGLPTSLRVVAWTFIGIGITSAINMIVQLCHKELFVDFSVLGIFCGQGLFDRSRGWRTFALIYLWIAMIGSAMVAIAYLFMGGFAPVMVGLSVKSTVPAWLVAVPAAAAVFFFAFWEYRVLTRPDVVSLFKNRDGLGGRR